MTDFAGCGIKHCDTSNSISWRPMFGSEPLKSDIFKLPKCKDDETVYCQLFLEDNRIGIKIRSQSSGTLVISGHIGICFGSPVACFAIEEQEVDEKVCFPFESSIKHITEIILFVSSASVRKKKQIFVAEKTCTATFLSNMERLLSNGDNADVEIHCKEGEVLKCHRILLAARSPVFKTMLESDFKEGNTGIIKLDYMDLDIVKNLLTFIYSGNLNNQKLALVLLGVADQFQIQDLKETCAEILADKMTVDNVLTILAASDRYMMAELKTSAMAMVVRNAKSLVTTAKFDEFCAECDKQLMVDIVKVLVNTKRSWKSQPQQPSAPWHEMSKRPRLDRMSMSRPRNYSDSD